MSTTDNEQEASQGYDLPGKRLDHILDQAEFHPGRGRQKALFTYLQENDPDTFGDLSYSTVRMWFSSASTPQMKRLSLVMDTLASRYYIPGDQDHVRTWWKIGGYYPFDDLGQTVDDKKKQHQLADEKWEYMVKAMISADLGGDISGISVKDMDKVSKKLMSFIKAFRDPAVTEAPKNILKILIKHEIGNATK